MKNIIASYIRKLLPLYVNGRLPRFQRRLVESWLARDAEARFALVEMRTLRRTLQAPVSAAPSKAAFRKIQAKARLQSNQPALQPSVWGLGMLLGIFLAVLAWYAMPPVNVLAWSIDGPAPSEFLIYRGTGSAEDTSFKLIDEIPATETQNYRYVDLWLQPGRTPVYRIEAVDAGGEMLTSEIVMGNSLAALPGQLALIGSGLVCLYGLSVFLSAKRRPALSAGWMMG